METPMIYTLSAGFTAKSIPASKLPCNSKFIMKKLILIPILLFTMSFSYGQGTWTKSNLSEPKEAMGAAALPGSNVFWFAGGFGGIETNQVEIYNAETDTWSYKTLSQARSWPAGLAYNNHIFFAGGMFWDSYQPTSMVDIWNNATSQWSTAELSIPRFSISAVGVGNKALFAGGGNLIQNTVSSTVDIYDFTTGLWTTTQLSGPRAAMGSAVVETSNGPIALFGGGVTGLAGPATDLVEIYHANTDSWSTAQLSEARAHLSATSVGHKVIFAGGITNDNVLSDRVDIYDNALNTWSTATLSSKRQHIGVAVIGSKIIFAGGINMASGISTNNVDVYDANTNTWTVHHLSQKKYAMTSAVVGTKAYFFGGIVNSAGSLSSRVEIYDSSTGLWTVKYLTGPHHAGVVTVTDERVMYSGGIETWGNIGTSKIEVLNIATGTWSVEQLSEPRLYLSSASFQHTAIVVGGVQVWSSYPLYTIPSKRVDIWNDNIIIRMIPEVKQDKHTVTIYPNPVVGLLHVQVSGSENEDYVYQLFTVSGQKVTEELHSNELINDMNIADLPKGVYILNVRFESGINSAMRVIKE